MQQGDMGIPLRANFDSETERMVFRDAKVVRSAFIHESEGAGRESVPGIRRNHIECGLQLCFERAAFFGTFTVLDVDARPKPFHYVPMFIMERHLPVQKRATCSVPTSNRRFGHERFPTSQSRTPFLNYSTDIFRMN